MSNPFVSCESVLKFHNSEKFAAVLAVVLLACSASAGEPVGVSVPVPVFADGETSAEVAIPAPGPDERILKITMAFEATPTNNVEFALSSGDGKEVIIGWDCGKWFARGGHLLEGWITVPASAPSAAGPRTLTLAVRFGRMSGMPLNFTLNADGASVAFAAPGPESLLEWLTRLGEWGQPLQVTATARGGAEDVSLEVAFRRDGSLIIVR